jgi:hypothetical protein
MKSVEGFVDIHFRFRWNSLEIRLESSEDSDVDFEEFCQDCEQRLLPKIRKDSSNDNSSI